MFPRPLPSTVYRHVADPDADPGSRHVEIVGWFRPPATLWGWLFAPLWELEPDRPIAPGPDTTRGIVGVLTALLLAVAFSAPAGRAGRLVALPPTGSVPPHLTLTLCAGGDTAAFSPRC